MAPDKVQSKIKRGMLNIRRNSLVRTGAQIGDGQGEVQARTGAQIGGGQGEVQVVLWPFTCPRRQLHFLSSPHRITNWKCTPGIGLRIELAPLAVRL